MEVDKYLRGKSKDKQIKVLSGGDLILRPEDEKAAGLLSDLKVERMEIARPDKWRPIIIVYDVERDVAREDIPKAIARLNPELGLVKDEAQNLIKPFFQKGPSERDTVWWVREILPSVYKKMIDAKRIFTFLHAHGVLHLGTRKISALTEANSRIVPIVADQLNMIGQPLVAKQLQEFCANESRRGFGSRTTNDRRWIGPRIRLCPV